MITKTATKVPLRGFKFSNGRQETKFMVELNGDKRWRRIYDRYVNGTSRPAKFVAVVKDGADYRDLTDDEMAHIGYAFATCRQLTAAEGVRLDQRGFGRVL